ncbi:MAG: polyphenol oxidase family protein, partial [Leptospirales bacterium]|nr:polyphenol oxidase family protein [Leptospirales bacterium]
MIFFTKNATGFYEINGLPANIKAGCAGRAANSIDYLQSSEEIRLAEKNILSAAVGLPEKDILSLEQVHGCDILIVEEKSAAPRAIYGTADAMLTSLEEVCLVIRAADCVPVILADKKSRAVAAVHSGWKGARLGICGAAAALMKERL